jgi:tetratricopeptide (TPR) repeat protein
MSTSFKLQITVLITIFTFGVNAQTNYESFFLNEQFDSVMIYSGALSSQDDYYWHSYLLAKNGNIVEAIRLIDIAIVNYPDITRLEKLKANIMFSSGQYALCKDLLVKYSSETEYYLKYIHILEFEKSHRKAIESLENRLQSDSLNLVLLVKLGDNYHQLDDLESAKKIYQRILILNPSDQATLLKVINILLKQKEYYHALTVTNNALSLDSTNLRFIRQKGIASFNLSVFETSEMCFRKLLVQGDSGVFILKHLGISEFHNNSFNLARQHLLLAYSQDPNDFETCFFIGRSYLNSPTPEKGLHYFNRVDSLLQPDPQLLATLYIEKQSIFHTLKEYERALECYEMAYELYPRIENIFYMASIHHNYLDNKAKALELYIRYLSELEVAVSSSSRMNQQSLMLKSFAEISISKIREDLFFEEGIDKSNDTIAKKNKM